MYNFTNFTNRTLTNFEESSLNTGIFSKLENLINRTIILKSNFNSTTIIPPPKKIRPWDFGDFALLICLILGSIGNILSIIVMQTKRMRNTNAALFITCIALSDTNVLLFKFISNMIKLYKVPIYNFCIFLQIIPQAAAFTSIWLIMLTSSERTAAVLFPLKVAIIFSKKRCILIISLIASFFLALCISHGLCSHYSAAQPHYCLIKGGENGSCFVYHTYVFPWFKSVFGSWLPSILGMTLNLIIILSLYKASKARKNIAIQYQNSPKLKRASEATIRRNSEDNNKKRNISGLLDKRKNSAIEGSQLLAPPGHLELQSKQNLMDLSNENIDKLSRNTSLKLKENIHQNSHKERQITIMLLTISISFVVLTLPYSAYDLLRKIGNFKWLKSRHVMRAVLFPIDLNHSTNFVFYCLTSQRIREELKYIFCSSKKEKQRRRVSSVCNYNSVNNPNPITRMSRVN